MSRIGSLKVMNGVLLVAFSSLAVAACGGGGSTKADTSKLQTQAAGSGYASAATGSGTVKVGTGVHVTNTPTKKFRVKSVDTTESVAVGPSGYPVYTFKGETSRHV